MTNTNTLPTPVDSVVSFSMPQRMELERIYRINGQVIKVKVVRDSSPSQSWGNVSLLAGDRVWTTLTVAAREVVAATRTSYALDGDTSLIESELGPIADALISRALRILGVTA
jgi:hypothetical protein